MSDERQKQFKAAKANLREIKKLLDLFKKERVITTYPSAGKWKSSKTDPVTYETAGAGVEPAPGE